MGNGIISRIRTHYCLSVSLSTFVDMATLSAAAVPCSTVHARNRQEELFMYTSQHTSSTSAYNSSLPAHVAGQNADARLAQQIEPHWIGFLYYGFAHSSDRSVWTCAQHRLRNIRDAPRFRNSPRSFSLNSVGHFPFPLPLFINT